MKSIRYIILLALVAVSAGALAGSALLDRSFRPLAGTQPVDLAATYGGQVLLIVNTASKCGFTPQFEALEKLHARYRAQGFAVLGFPSGDFKAQEFEDEKDIQEFCTLTYGVRFPMFEKVHVVGDAATPLYRDLAAATGAAPGCPRTRRMTWTAPTVASSPSSTHSTLAACAPPSQVSTPVVAMPSPTPV